MTIYTTPESFIDPTPTPAQRFGSAIGTGLTSGLEMLAKDRLEKMKHERLQSLISELSGRPGITGEIEEKTISPGEGISDEAILAVSMQDPMMGKLLQGQKEAREKQVERRAKREFERAKPVLARADERAEEITQKESALNLMEDALKEGNVGFLSPDNLAEITGIEGLRTAKGAQFISSGKEYFLGSLKRAGTRPNQWIEQQIQKMLPKIGRSEKANLTVIEALKSELDIEKEQLDIIDRLSQEDEDKFGYIKGNIGQRARKDLKKFADEEQKKLESRLRDIQERYQPQKIDKKEVVMINPAGERVAVEKKDIKEAKKEGYRIE